MNGLDNLSIDQLSSGIATHSARLDELEKEPDKNKYAIAAARQAIDQNTAELQGRMRQSAGPVVGGRGEQHTPPVHRVETGIRSIFEGARIEGSNERVHVYRGNEPISQASHEAGDMPSIGDIVAGMAGSSVTSGVREALNTGSDASGGVMLSAEISNRFLDNIRPRSVAMRAGVGMVPMKQPWMRVITQTGDPTAHWRAEGSAVDPSAPTFGKYEVKPKFLGCVVVVTQEQWEDAANTAAIVQSAIENAMAVELDEAVLTGSGADNQPTGIRNWAGTIAGTMAGAVSYGMVSQAVRELMDANFPGDPKDLGWICNPRDRQAFVELVDTTGQPLRPNPWCEAVKPWESTKMPINLGAGTDLGSHIIGHFPSATLFVHRGLRLELMREGTVANNALVVTDYLASEWKYMIRASFRADLVVERPGFFYVANDFDHDGA